MADDHNHAAQDHHKVPLWRIILLSTMGGGIDMLYAIEDVYAAPLLVAVGVDIHYASMMLGLSPMIGIFLQSYLGPLSDQCQCNWGRRRPFILILSLTACLGLITAPFAPYLSLMNVQFAAVFSIMLTFFGIMTMDLSIGQLMLPSRAYLLDVVPSTQSQLGNFIYIAFLGLGGAIGYALGGIDWSGALNRQVNIINQAQLVFGIALIVMIVSLICTLVSVKERPYISSTESSRCLKCCPCAQNPKNCCKGFFKTLWQSVKFFYCMSKDMWILWITVTCGSIALYAFSVFFSTFVGRSVYGGISDAPKDTVSYILYAEGVRMSSWALTVGAGVLTLLSMLFDSIAKVIGLKLLFILIQYIFVVVLFVQVIFTNVGVSFISACCGMLFIGIHQSVPFALLPIYEDNNMMLRKSKANQFTANKMGTACFCINVAVLLGQSIAVTITGPLIDLFQSATASIVTSSVFAAVAILFSTFVNVPNH
jgi:solute carrier family 45 protein 1/2/4